MRKYRACALISICLALLLAALPGWLRAQAQPSVLVIEGGTLIDGNGGAPVPNAVVVIEGNKIVSVSRKGEAPAYPANAWIIRADGKYVLPGLFDSQNSYSWYFGEAMLNHGVTSTIDVGTTGETAVPYRDAVFHGKVRGPRTFTGISRLSVNPNLLVSTGLENPLTHTRVPKSVEETRQFVKAWIAAGADYILTYDGALPMDYYKAAFEEANKAGVPVFTRAYGPVLFPKDAALLGAANLPHSAGIGIAVTKDPSKFKEGATTETNWIATRKWTIEGARTDPDPGGAPRVADADVHDQFSGISQGVGSIHRGSTGVLQESGASRLLSAGCNGVRPAKLRANRQGRSP